MLYIMLESIIFITWLLYLDVLVWRTSNRYPFAIVTEKSIKVTQSSGSFRRLTARMSMYEWDMNTIIFTIKWFEYR